MKQSTFLKTIAFGMLAWIAITSFTINPGGEGYTVFVNDKIVLQRYGKEMDEVKSITLSHNSKVAIQYYHCGKSGKNRLITIRDAKNELVRQFRYADSEEITPKMGFNLSEVSALTAPKGNLNVFYSSSELPKGRKLFVLSFQ